MLKKEELEALGFHKSVNHNNMFYKPGFELWTLEVQPGNTYVKAAIRQDMDGGKPQEYEYCYTIEAIERFFERLAPVNPNDVDHLQKSYSAPPRANHYNDELYHHPDTRD